MDLVAGIREKYDVMKGLLDERARRVWAASEARAIGHGGVARVAEATGMSRTTVIAGKRELERPREGIRPGHVRRAGAGRKKITETDPGLAGALDALVDPVTRGDPESPLRWTCKSTYTLADELTAQGHPIDDRKVAQLLHAAGYSLQANRKTREGASHPDRNAQFEHINAMTRRFQRGRQPVVSVDTKKKELVGNFRNGGREWLPSGHAREVKVHDFVEKGLGKAIPYGVYDVTANEGWVSVGTDHDTAEFAVATISRWWRNMGARAYPDAKRLLIVADGGGSNGSRARLWKTSLQKFADRTGLKVTVCHFPPGTSKWNKIEHRMFSQISMNWRAQPLVSHEVAVNLIAGTTTRTGLRIRAQTDTAKYATGKKVSDKEIAAVRLSRAAFHGEWNYTIGPAT